MIKAMTAGELSIYPERYEVILNGESVPLRPKEFEVLLYFVQRPGMVITRDDLMNVVWGFDYIGGQRTVDVHVSSLRKKHRLRHSVIRMVRPARIHNPLHATLVRQPVRQAGRVGRCRPQAQRQRGQAALRQPAVEGIARQTPDADGRVHLRQQVALAGQNAQRHVAVTADHLRQTLHYHIRPELQRFGQDGRREGVVHHEQTVALWAKAASVAISTTRNSGLDTVSTNSNLAGSFRARWTLSRSLPSTNVVRMPKRPSS